jgi:glycosyltransferase involved in cell wall biosynthesis
MCHRRAPTLRAWLEAAEEVLPRHFEEVEVWSLENQIQHPRLKFRKFPSISPFWPIRNLAFRWMAQRAYNRLSAADLSRTLVQCSGEHLPVADIRLIQFWNIAYSRLAEKKPESLPLSLRDRIFVNDAIRKERAILQPGATGEWWCVSRGIAEPIRREAPEGSLFRYLPNSYDPERFNPGARARFRSEMRAHYGFTDEEIIFVFCSFGHFVRKGLLQAAEAVANLRKDGLAVRLLVLGGLPEKIAEFRNLAASRGVSCEGLTFAGMVNPAEQHLAAADAMLFPSHFEAFSLVEIEAAALGLRLYLTAHPGSEMILKEGVNGRLLPWDVPSMTALLRDEIATGSIAKSHAEMGEALAPWQYAAQMDLLYKEAIARKSGQAG